MEKELVNIEDHAMTAEKMQGQVNTIQKMMRQVMKPGEHYGKIPGCGNKPTLLKPGAEKLSLLFRLAPSYQIQRGDLPGGHREYEVVCTLTHMTTGMVVGQGVGSCSTMEGKYRFRKAEQKCPECGKEGTVIKGKKDYGGGWLCWGKKGGCGAKFEDGDERIENQEMGRVEHDNPADYYNTVLKMAKKRSHVDAILTATAASDIFTQDIEDMDFMHKPDSSDDAPPKGNSKEAPPKDNGKGAAPSPREAMFDALIKEGLTNAQMADFAGYLRGDKPRLEAKTMVAVAGNPRKYITQWEQYLMSL